MKLLDNSVNNILSLEKPFSFFEDFSEFSKNAVGKMLYYFDIIKDNIEGNVPETKEIPTVIFTCPGRFPTESRKITSYFGSREHPISGKTDFHTGLDIAVPKGVPVTASWPGKVAETDSDKIYGNYVIIEHSSGFTTKYCHLSKIAVKEEAFINVGEKLGEAGNTGLSTGSHLHFEVTVDGKNVDPLICLGI